MTTPTSGGSDHRGSCPSCGAPVAAFDSFCSRCGGRLAPDVYPPPVSAPQPRGISKLWIVFGILVGLLAVVMGSAGLLVFLNGRSDQAGPTPVPSTPSPSASPSVSQLPPGGIAQVTIKVNDCDDCVVTANWSAFSYANMPKDPAELWSSGPMSVSAGEVSFGVPIEKSVGLSFEVTSPRERIKDAVPIAVVRYVDAAVGAPVSPQAAEGSKAAYGCWAGTKLAEQTLDLQVDWYPGVDIEGRPAEGLRAYFNPGLESYGDPQDAYSGSLGHQNVWACLQ